MSAPKQPPRKLFNLEGEADKSDVESSLGYLLDKDNALLTTEIDNPIAVTMLEVFADDLREEMSEISDVIDGYVKKFKINMIPYKRKRATEAIQIADAASGRKAEREKSRLREKLFGAD